MTTSTAPVVEISGLTKRFGDVTALDDVSLSFQTDAITGLLGRNGAGKTTLMQTITGQDFATAGEIRVFGEHPVENAKVLSRVSFIKESQKYPDEFKPKHVFGCAPWFYENWDADLAAQLVDDFQLPVNRRIKKLSRGQLSAVGVIVGLAARAPLTFFDEPYLGLDAVARQIFYDRLLADYSEHPRTIILSTHLIDEVANILEHVVVIDKGRIVMDESAESARDSATTVVGSRGAVEAFIAGRRVLHREGIGGLASVTVERLDADERRDALAAGLELAPVSLQQLIVRSTNSTGAEFGAETQVAGNGALS
ncbi:ABC transporter ATP-binding protein [Rathayibacter sp. CAU 1779]